MCSIIVLLPHYVVAFDNAESRTTLRGVNALEVGVGEVIPAVARPQVTSETIRTVGYGESRPLASNSTPEGRSQQWRIEVVNLGRMP